MTDEQIIIIGAGPAGIACGIQLKRYGLDPLLIDKEGVGGLVKNAWRIDNYAGFPDGISGPEMVGKLQEHLSRFEVRYQRSEIRKVKFFANHFSLQSSKVEYRCKILVVATGTKPRHQGEGYTEVFPVRDVKEKKIDIVGAGDAAFDYAMTLCKHNEIHIHNRGTEIKCVPALLDIALKEPDIHYHENSAPSYSSDYTIFATGREPELGFISDELKIKMQALEQDGLLHVIGDVKNGMVRQTSVAVGDGVRAAMAIIEKMKQE